MALFIYKNPAILGADALCLGFFHRSNRSRKIIGLADYNGVESVSKREQLSRITCFYALCNLLLGIRHVPERTDNYAVA